MKAAYDDTSLSVANDDLESTHSFQIGRRGPSSLTSQESAEGRPGLRGLPSTVSESEWDVETDLDGNNAGDGAGAYCGLRIGKLAAEGDETDYSRAKRRVSFADEEESREDLSRREEKDSDELEGNATDPNSEDFLQSTAQLSTVTGVEDLGETLLPGIANRTVGFYYKYG